LLRGNDRKAGLGQVLKVFELHVLPGKPLFFLLFPQEIISDEGFRAAGILEWARRDQLKNREATSERRIAVNSN
jgi:hypothetical protein